MRLPGPRLMGLRGAAMELFTKLFSDLLVFVYHCFDRIVIHGYLSGLSRPEQVVFFFRQVVGAPVVSKELLSQRTTDYQNWVEAFARNHDIPIQWAEKGVRKEDFVRPWLRRMVKKGTYGVYFIFKSMEQGPSFRVTVPKFPTKDPNHRILAHQKSRFTHNYFYIRDEVLGPMIMRVATFFPFQTTYYLNGHNYIEQELNRAQIGFRKMSGKLATVIDQIEHGHHVYRAYFKHAFLKQYEKFSTFLRNELCSNNLKDFGLRKGLDNLEAVREKLQAITSRFASFQAHWLNVHVDFPLLQRIALPITIGSVRYPGIKIHETRIIRLMEVLLHGGTHVGGWTAKQIHEAVLTTFGLSDSGYRLNQLRYDLRKLKGDRKSTRL